MSFILDALRKSETDRQQKGSAEFAGVPTSSARREGPPAWLWVVAALLLINSALLLGLFLRPDAEPAGSPALRTEEPAAPAVATADEDFAEQVEVARRNAPPREEPAPEPQARPEVRAAVPVPASVPTNALALPTIHEVRANGTLSLPDLHVDIHVYSESPKDRFVFINMVKHNEGSRLPEGPRVAEITPDGVVLEQDGTTFLLPRD